MSYFSHDFIEFFKDLSSNNNKTWFDQNRKRYETAIKRPFQEFVQEMIDRIRTDDPSVDILPKDAIMRINRDIRFSNDKTPYHTYVSAIISASGKKDKTTPGSYIHLNAEKVTFYGGAYMLEKDQLFRVRKAIAENLENFSELTKNSDFKRKFGEVRGEQNKRIQPEFSQAAAKQPLLFNKQFYFGADLESRYITTSELPDILMEYYHAGKPLNEFLRRSLAG